MSVGSDIALGLSLTRKAAAPLIEEEKQWSRMSTLDKILDVLNRGTEGSASAFNELLFEPTPEPVRAFLEGIQGRGKVENFGELSKKAGWNPETREGKAAQFLLSTVLDVGLAPDTYFSFGAAPTAKLLGKGAGLAKLGVKAAQASKEFGPGVGEAIGIINRATKFKDPRVDEVVAKLLKGEDITKAEEAVLGARTMFGLQAPFGHKMFGLEGLVPQLREANVKFFTDMQKVESWLQTAPVISPALHGISAAFNSFSELKRKAPEFFRLRRGRDQKIQHTTAQAFERAVRSIAKMANKDEREVITQLMEMPDPSVVVGSYFKDVTKLVDMSPELRVDLGFPKTGPLGEEDSVELVNHWLTKVNQWLAEFDKGGVMDRSRMLEENDALQGLIRVENMRIQEAQKIIDDLKGRAPDEFANQAKQAGLTVAKVRAAQQRIIDMGRKSIEEFEANIKANDEAITRILGPDVSQLTKYDLGEGAFGHVKGRWDIVKYQNHVIKLPVSLDTEAFTSMVAEEQAYKALEGIPGVGSARLVFKEIPLQDLDDGLASIMFPRHVPSAGSGGTWDIDPELRALMEEFAEEPKWGQARTGEVGIDGPRTQEAMRAAGMGSTPPPTPNTAERADIEAAYQSWKNRGQTPVTPTRSPTPPGVDTPQEFMDGGHIADLAQEGFVITRSDGVRVLKVPFLVKNLVDIDQAGTTAFHRGAHMVNWKPDNEHYRMHRNSIRSFEKLLTRASRQGVSLSDLHGGNLVIDKKGQAHVLDIGYGLKVDKTEAGIQRAWRENLLRFAHHVVFNTKYTNKEAQDSIRRLIQKHIMPTGGHGPIRSPITDSEIALVKAALRRAGMPVRYLSENAATKPLVEGFASITVDGLKKGGRQLPEHLKITQRKLVEERDLLLTKLSPEAKEAYENVMLWKRQMTDRLLANGLLTEEWITAFEQKFGIPHLRHLKTQEGLVRRFQMAMRQAITKQAGTLKARKIEGAIKDIHDRLGREFFETDIAKIMFASEVEVTTAIENWKLLNKVADNPQWTKPALESSKRVPIKRGRNKGEFRTVKVYTPEEGYEIINHPLFEGKMVRAEIADDIRGMMEKTRKDLGADIIRKWYDPVHNWLRAYTLFLFPSYHIRNFAGAIWNNLLADVEPTMHLQAHKVIFGGKPLKQWSQEFSRGVPFEIDGIRSPNPTRKLPFNIDGKSMSYQEILDEMNEMGVLGRGQMGPHGDVERGLMGEFDPLYKGPKSLLPTQDNTFVRFGAKVGTQIENVVRAAHYISKRKFGLNPLEASMSVKKYQFDYNDLSPFEKNWMKRIFFFYTWTRKNLPLQAKMFLLRPGKYTGAVKTAKEVETQSGGPDPDARLLPEWLNKQFGVRFRYDPKTKSYEYFMLNAWLPAADLVRLLNPGEELMNMLSPIPKQAIEQAWNKSTFFDEPLEEYPGERKEFLSPEAGKALAKIPGAESIATILAGSPVSEGIQVSGRVNNILRQFRVANEARRILEADARGGPGLALTNALLGKSYEFNPSRALTGKSFEIKMLIGRLKHEMRQAQRRGKPTEARRLRERIRELTIELQAL